MECRQKPTSILSSLEEAVSQALIPKLAAQIQPPKTEDVVYREGALDTGAAWYKHLVSDFVEAAAVCGRNGLMHAHTSLSKLKFRDSFLKRDGLSILHWHGYPVPGNAPYGYRTHGKENPPVSCSTPQSAVFSAVGKIIALERAICSGSVYLGDLHIEPHHGANLVGALSLAEAAQWVDGHR